MIYMYIYIFLHILVSCNENKDLMNDSFISMEGVGTSDSKVKVFDVRCMKLQQQYSVHEAPVNQVK